MTRARDSLTMYAQQGRGKKDPTPPGYLRELAKALEGDYREEHVFALKQSLECFRYYQRLVAEVNQEIHSRLQSLETSPAARAKPPQRTKHSTYQGRHYEPASFDLPG